LQNAGKPAHSEVPDSEHLGIKAEFRDYSEHLGIKVEEEYILVGNEK
jgi:hypothetical protein